MVSPSDLDILRYGQRPNVIITADRVTAYDAHQDCGSCGAWQRAAWVALAPSLSDAGYRVVSVCTPCADRYVRDGSAVDRRPSDGRATSY